MKNSKIIQVLALCCATLLGLGSALSLAEIEMEVRGDKERVSAKRISAVITDIDSKTREITLEGPLGNLITIEAGPEITRFEEFSVGDLVVATYVSSISGELRAPTEAELAEPMVVLDAAAVAGQGAEPGAAAGLSVRAICTVEGMNRMAGTVMLQDPEGDFHIIEDVDPENMKGVALGDTIIVTYTQAFALTLEKQVSAN